MERRFHFLKFLNGFKILQKLFITVFPKVSRNLTHRRQDDGIVPRNTQRSPSFAQGPTGLAALAAAGCSSWVHTRRKRKRCLLSRCLCFSAEPSAPLPWDYLVYLALTWSGRENKGLYWSDRCTAPCRATALAFETRSYWEKSSGAVTDHLAHRGEIRLHFLISVKHPEYGQWLT